MKKLSLLQGLLGFLIYTLVLGFFITLLPDEALSPGSKQFILVTGGLALWRYSWGMTHFIRSIIYRKLVFPGLRAKVQAHTDILMPPHIYLLVTSFRIDVETTTKVFEATFRDAMNCGIPATVVPSLVDLSDEILVRDIHRRLDPEGTVKLVMVRIPGTGKRDGLAHGFRAIAAEMPPSGSVAAVIDGDSILQDDLIRRCAPFFKMMPKLGALTTDEICEVKGTRLIREWHDLRFAQRQILMCSVSLSRKVLTLTGRMSMFRAEIITHPDFIAHIQEDSIDHWRLGRFKFLTGDDKSSWYWVLKQRYEMIYIPDTIVTTVEHPPGRNFVHSTSMLMFRWFGNMLRTNGRALALGPRKCGLFTWWCIVDQRISMWTSLSGVVIMFMFSMAKSAAVIPIYIVWIAFTRWIMTLMLLTSRPVVSWYYPFLIYYNQIWGSLIKTYVFFRLDRQSWTRQKTKLNHNRTEGQQMFVNASSVAMHSVAIIVFVALIGMVSGLLTVPLK
ncbi:MAG: glycosyl transferase [Alphaproteobacteria bacterium]|nr:glycosyl transferase [Alphaproteobacteria bacterium]